jgi:hypothetical protein
MPVPQAPCPDISQGQALGDASPAGALSRHLPGPGPWRCPSRRRPVQTSPRARPLAMSVPQAPCPDISQGQALSDARPAGAPARASHSACPSDTSRTDERHNGARAPQLGASECVDWAQVLSACDRVLPLDEHAEVVDRCPAAHDAARHRTGKPSAPSCSTSATPRAHRRYGRGGTSDDGG